MRKKLSILLLTLAMCMSLVACSGGINKQPAIDAFNKASTAYDSLADEVNANADLYSQELFDILNEIADTMKEHKAILESDQELTQEKIDEMIATYENVESQIADLKANLGSYVDTGADRQPAIDIFNQVSEAYDEIVEQINANIDAYPQDTIDFMTQMGTTLTECKALLESDTKLTEEQVNALVSDLTNINNWIKDSKEVLLEKNTPVADSEQGNAQAGEVAGSADKQPAIDTFNLVGPMFNATAEEINKNIDAYDQDFINTFNELADYMAQYQEILTSDAELTEEDVNSIIEDLTTIEQWLKEIEKDVFG